MAAQISTGHAWFTYIADSCVAYFQTFQCVINDNIACVSVCLWVLLCVCH